MINHTPSDADLVAATLHGDRDAFATLVERHQQLVCALAYAKTGSLAASEDIAQETFVAAWKDLAHIRAPENLRGWLCGTARHLAARFRRREKASALLTEDIADAGVPQPHENAITREEEAMMWAALEQLPENFREPLILYYRTGHSVREVAEALDLSEDAVKQRLSRGRIVLQETVHAKVESALASSHPGPAFTIAVVASIPALTSSAQAAGTGLAAAKGAGSVAIGALLPVLGGSFIGLAGAWIGMRDALRRAESDRERRFIMRTGRWAFVTIAISMAIMAVLLVWAGPMQARYPALWVFLMAANMVSFCATLLVFGIINGRHRQRIRAEERLKRGTTAAAVPSKDFEYRSRLHFLGCPLVHVCLRAPGIAIGWIAIGNVAIAPLAAFGGVAIGGIAFGGISVGLLVTACIGMGLVSYSAIALGGVAVGGLAVGWLAAGAGAWGWLAALGGLATARYYAIGNHALALHANDATARAFFHDDGLVQAAGAIATYGAWVQLVIAALFSFGLLWLQRHPRR